MRIYRLQALLVPCLFFAACQMGAPEGLRLTPPGEGPVVMHDINHKPLPEIPFPNDIATRADASSLTGRRINASMIAPTRLERSVRKKLDRLDGFGTLQPITVSFDAPLDIAELLARQRDNLDFADDAVYLIDISPDSPTYAQPVLLDIGRGNYPLTLKRSDRYFPSDPRQDATNLLFDTITEDTNGNGLLDPGEDSDDDGVLDRPNVWPPDADPKDGLMTFYESETNTLILRPVVPLREQTTYAVVLTDRLLGRNGQPVRSPFEWVHHLNQAHDLDRLHDVFNTWRSEGLELSVDQLAFAWSFSTQSVTAELVAVREGYNGVGPLAWLADEFSVHVTPLKSKSPDQPPPYYLVEAESLMNVFKMVGPSILGDNMNIAGPILDSFGHVEYFASGSFASADFMRTGPNGLDPANMHSENFDLDLKAGTAAHSRNSLRFVLAVPKITAEHQPPFPVAIYCHSYSSLRAEALGFAGYLAKQGIASVGIDAWGHGMPADEGLADIIITTGGAFGFEPFAAELLEDRARDVNGDGANDSGADYWTAYGFHTRDVVRQTVADHFQLVRVLKSFDGKRTWDLDQDEDGEHDLAGDFDGDGLVDIGGPDVPYFAWGQSGGGITSAVLSPLEPSIIAAAPTAGGGGMSDVGLRTMLGNVRNAVMLRTMGPLVIGERGPDDTLRVSLMAALGTDDPKLPIATVEGLRPGDRVTVTNLDKGEAHLAHVREGPRFRVSMEADAGDRFEVAFHDPDGQLIARLATWQEDVFFHRNDLATFAAGDALASPAEGFGLARCTPSLRRMVGLLQMILEPADPANMATHYFLDPLYIRPEGRVVTNVLELACLGDQDVPVQTQATLGRAAGLIPYLEVDPRYGTTPNDWLIKNYVYEGLPYIGRFEGSDAVFDPDNLDEGRDGFDVPQPEPGDELRSVIETDTGVSGIRFAYLLPGGQHGIFPTGEENDFDVFTFFVSQVAHFFASRGTQINDDLCLATASCPPP